MSTVAQSGPLTGRAAGTRIASYLLAEYLERLGVEVIFGLCGHTNIAFLDALGKSSIRFVTYRSRRMRPTGTRVRPAKSASSSPTWARG